MEGPNFDDCEVRIVNPASPVQGNMPKFKLVIKCFFKNIFVIKNSEKILPVLPPLDDDEIGTFYYNACIIIIHRPYISRFGCD